MFGLGMPELLVLLTLGLLLFGSKLPSLARSLGQSVTAFRHGVQGLEGDFRS